MPRKPVPDVTVIELPSLTGSNTHIECPCGWDLYLDADRVHPRGHYQWAWGLDSLPALERHETAITVVSTTSPMPWRKQAHRMAELTMRSLRQHDITFPAPYGRGVPDEENTRALLYHYRGRVVGYLAAFDGTTQRRYDLSSREMKPTSNTRARTIVATVFVAFHWRSLGIGTALVNTLANHTDTTTRDLAWHTPFTAPGIALARAHATASQLWVG